MSEETEPRPASGAVRPVKQADRLQREAAALRANLRKRKDQARERQRETENPLPKQD